MLKLSPDEAALLKAVCADRDNDLPRLVYADWLDDHGRPERAEFIRLQVRAAAQPGDHTRYHVEPRVAELLTTHSGAWSRELPKWAVNKTFPEFVRGFIERFTFPAAQFLRHGPQLLDRTPVRGLQLWEVGRVVEELTLCPWVREVPDISLKGTLPDTGAVVRLASADWLVGTRRLNLAGNGLGDPAARALASCPRLAGLEALDLSDNPLTPAAVEWLLASPHLQRCYFRLAGCYRLSANRHAIRRLLGPRGTL
jgi:uncharacterized protein (TIGR02996 family)